MKNYKKPHQLLFVLRFYMYVHIELTILEFPAALDFSAERPETDEAIVTTYRA